MSKVIMIITDSLGVGAMPDAPNYGDRNADTFGHILEKCERNYKSLDYLKKMM